MRETAFGRYSSYTCQEVPPPFQIAGGWGAKNVRKIFLGEGQKILVLEWVILFRGVKNCIITVEKTNWFTLIYLKGSVWR